MKHPTPKKEKYPELRSAKEHFLETLDNLCESVEGVARRRELLRKMADLIDKVEQGLIMDAIVSGKGVINSITDCGSDSIALVYNNGWALGFEGDGGELVILIDAINDIRFRNGRVQIDLDTGEGVSLRFHGRQRDGS